MFANSTLAPQRHATTNPLPRDDLVPWEQDVATWRRIPSNDRRIFSHTERQVIGRAKPDRRHRKTADSLWELAT
jgi:hypothetical protein